MGSNAPCVLWSAFASSAWSRATNIDVAMASHIVATGGRPIRPTFGTGADDPSLPNHHNKWVFPPPDGDLIESIVDVGLGIGAKPSRSSAARSLI